MLELVKLEDFCHTLIVHFSTLMMMMRSIISLVFLRNHLVIDDTSLIFSLLKLDLFVRVLYGRIIRNDILMFVGIVFEDDRERSPASLLVRKGLALDLPKLVLKFAHINLHHLDVFGQLIQFLFVFLVSLFVFRLVFALNLSLAHTQLILQLLSQLIAVPQVAPLDSLKVFAVFGTES